ncbi:hypothetical protein DWW31_18165 [Clostridium sp. AF15-17LB]|nr:hypothetical protein DWW31_18165 [Clostridium sp. AF15-17LB]
MLTKERIDGNTPSGGEYSEIYYFDDDMKAVDKSMATKIKIRECLSDGTLVNETAGRRKQHG